MRDRVRVKDYARVKEVKKETSFQLWVTVYNRVFVCLCVCVCDKERERESNIQ